MDRNTQPNSPVRKRLRISGLETITVYFENTTHHSVDVEQNITIVIAISC